MSISDDAAPPPIPPAVPKQTCGLVTASLILGLLSALCLGPLAGIPAIICGYLALSRIKRSGGMLQGRGMAIVGLVLGYVMTALTFALIPLLVVFAAQASVVSPFVYTL